MFGLKLNKIWIIFTRLKLWFAVARHNFKRVKNLKKNSLSATNYNTSFQYRNKKRFVNVKSVSDQRELKQIG